MKRTKEEELERARLWKKNNQDKVKLMRRLYYENHKQKERKQNINWIINNKEEYKIIRKISNKKYRENNSEQIKEWTKNNRTKINNLKKEQYNTNINYNISTRLRASLTQALKLSSNIKTISIIKLLDISIPDFKIYLESKFKEGMNWNNRKEWHIDHIKPCAAFNLSNIEEQKKCFHYTNFQPLWKNENLSKSSNYKGKNYRYN